MNRAGRSGVYPTMQSQLPVHDPPVALATPTGLPPNDADDRELEVELSVVPIDPRRDFEAFYRDGYADIARALAVTLGDLDLAQEATDEAMVRAYVRWQKIGAYDNPGGWVYRVGLNWARSARRRLGRVVPFHERRRQSRRRCAGHRSRALRRVAGSRREPARGRRVPPAARLVGRRDRHCLAHQARHGQEPPAPGPHPARTNPRRCLVNPTQIDQVRDALRREAQHIEPVGLGVGVGATSRPPAPQSRARGHRRRRGRVRRRRRRIGRSARQWPPCRVDRRAGRSRPRRRRPSWRSAR